MKKLTIIATILMLALNSKAQQTEDDPAVGDTWRTFGNFKGTDAKNIKDTKGLIIITGRVVNVSWCEEDCLTILVKTNDGNTISVGTKDYAFSVPKDISGKKIVVEGYEPSKLLIAKKGAIKAPQKDIQVAASGVKVYK